MATEAEVDLDALRLALLPGVGPRTRLALLAHFRSATNVLNASKNDLQEVDGIGAVLSRQIHEQARTFDVSQIVTNCNDHGIEMVLDSDPRYPRLLHEIYDPPGVLFLWGELNPRDSMSVAIVGTRHATSYGLRQATRLAEQLVYAGYTVTSGLARGVDRAAHEGAISARGRTIAVLGGGFLRLYPPEHRQLAEQIRAHGGLLSEAAPLTPPSSVNFPRRNRIITGMSLGVVVVEAGARSGALISARHALEQGREVFAVPGQIDNPVARGCHRLLRDGAKLVEDIDDVLEELGTLMASAAGDDRTNPSRPMHPCLVQPCLVQPCLVQPCLDELNERERRVWDAIGDERIPIDFVIANSGLSTPEVLATLSALELRKLVRRVSGAFVEKIH